MHGLTPMQDLQISVLNKHALSDTLPGVHRVVIMRGTPLGNPFPMKGRSQEERDRVCKAYEGWLRDQWRDNGPARAELERLYALAQQGPLELVCCCAPKRCHGHFVKEALLGMHKQRTKD